MKVFVFKCFVKLFLLFISEFIGKYLFKIDPYATILCIMQVGTKLKLAQKRKNGYNSLQKRASKTVLSRRY